MISKKKNMDKLDSIKNGKAIVGFMRYLSEKL
jgi:hypothetical protein